MNEYGLSIGESTWGGREELNGDSIDDFIMDYGSLIYVTLQRCKTAKEAINTMIDLANTHGYHSSGETFTIADKDEIWIMDFIGKGTKYIDGTDQTKVVYVAQKITDGHISGHANQARTMVVDTSAAQDPDSFIFAADVKTFAVRCQFITDDGTPNVDFTEAYNPLTFSGLRACEARVFTFFNRAGIEKLDQFHDYIRGHDKHNRFALSYELTKQDKLTVSKLQDAIGDHYENTPLDMTKDVGAGPWKFKHRFHPLEWTVKNEHGEEDHYLHERPIGTQQTGWSFIAVLPHNDVAEEERRFKSTFYFGVDDATYSVHIPFYPCITRLPACLESKPSTSGVDHEVYSISHFSRESLFWVSNLVANFAYQDQEHIGAAVLKKRKDLDDYLASAKEQPDTEIMRIYTEQGKDAACEYATVVCNEWAEMVHAEWTQLFEHLFVKYVDMVQRSETEGHRDPTITPLEYPREWVNRIAKYTGTHYLMNQPKQ